MLVIGEAGIGKTSLVNDLAFRATGPGVRNATGHCLDIEAAMSFAPAVEALRSCSGYRGIRDRPHARRMGALLDPNALHPIASGCSTTSGSRSSSLRHTGTLLLIEDMHWADRSTLELVSALARTARGRLLLVLTVRSDELHRRHPFRTALAELTRLDSRAE